MYLIPIILAFLLAYNFPKLQKKVVTDINNVNQDVYFYEVKKQKILNKISSVHNIKVVKDIQKYAKQIQIKITTLKVIKQNIAMEIQGQLKPILKFIDFTENYNDITKVENLMLSKSSNNGEVKVFLNLTFSKIIRTKPKVELSNEINGVNNPFILKVVKPLPKLYAIVNNHVLINNRWLQENDTFDGYTVKKIHLDFVELESDANVFKIGLFGQK